MKRFWNHAVAVRRPEGGHAVLLDGKPLRLPGGAPLATPSGPLAEAIAAEWHAAGGAEGGRDVDGGGAADPPAGHRAGPRGAGPARRWSPASRNTAETDLLCYRAEEPALGGDAGAGMAAAARLGGARRMARRWR